jgi:polar amino acid transport system ATP-binding protein
MSPLTSLLRRTQAAGAPGAAASSADAPSTADATSAADSSTSAARPSADARTRGGLVEIRGVHKAFGDLEVLRGIDLTIEPGEVTVVLGPSGSGKSTLLRAINHLEPVTSGLISVDGEVIGYRRDGDRLHELREPEVLRQRTAIGMVFQSFNLFAHMTALANVAEAPRRALGVTRKEAEAHARELLALVGLSEKEGAYPRQLSGGQQQRVAIARALALRPKVLLFDEPTSALDPELVEEVLAVIRSLASAGTTLVIVTHEISFARDVADTVVFMDQGRIVEQGPPAQVIDRPAHERTRAFLQRVRTGADAPAEADPAGRAGSDDPGRPVGSTGPGGPAGPAAAPSDLPRSHSPEDPS